MATSLVETAQRAPPATVYTPPVKPAISLRAKAILALDRGLHDFHQFAGELRDELLVAWTTPTERDAITASIYASQPTYSEGGRMFRDGLFAWESAVLDSPHFPRAGRVLLGGAGGGREIAALIERGYDVSAFEPSDLYAQALASAQRSRRSTVVRASYSHLIDAVAGRPSPLETLVRTSKFDAVILGWGSFSHVIDPAERESLLRATHSLAPRAPVLLSYLPRAPSQPPRGWRRLLRSVLGRAPSSHDPGFSQYAGFWVGLDDDDITQLAALTGYRVAMRDSTQYPHAVLVPIE